MFENKRLTTIIIGSLLVLAAVVVLLVSGISGDDEDTDTSGLDVFTDTAVTTVQDSDESASEPVQQAESAPQETTAVETTLQTAPEYVSYTFRTKKQFDSHYEKHGKEFGDITQEEYLNKANALINNTSDTILHKTEAEDGDYIFYDTENNEILFLSTDGYIRTYFKPNRGIDYYNDQ